MKILKRLQVPTGDILIVEGNKGQLEVLSIGDYGKEVNLKCDSMGLTRKPDIVRHTNMLSLEEKWVITLSTQYGCSMNCSFCDVPKVGKGRNATLLDLIYQIKMAMSIHPEVYYSNRLNIHYARMGEPTWNPNIYNSAVWLWHNLNNKYKIHPVVSTIMPNKNKKLKDFITSWIDIKNRLYNGNAGLQLSINSTSEIERNIMFNHNALSLKEISNLMNEMEVPVGRKITLNFAVANYEINPKILLKYFDPEYYIIKLTPMHKTITAIENNIKTKGNYTEYYPYESYEKDLINAGYNVLVFIASLEEDLGRITCGNAILSGSVPEVNYNEILYT